MEHVDDFQIIADIFRQLGDMNRIRLFWLLCHMEECVINLAAMMKMSSPAISHHLKILKTSNLIESRRDGKEVYYRAGNSPQCALLHQMIEQIMEIACPEPDLLPESLDHSHFRNCQEKPEMLSCHCEEEASSHAAVDKHVTKYQEEQMETIRKIHDQLILHLDQRHSVEELARTYLMNPTTLKLLFRDVYGMSIAAHIRKHRMEEAARLLRETSLSIGEIAEATGYASQSKFTAAFKESYQVLPREYRKCH